MMVRWIIQTPGLIQAVKKCADVQSILLDLLGEKVGINNIMDSDVSFLEF